MGDFKSTTLMKEISFELELRIQHQLIMIEQSLARERINNISKYFEKNCGELRKEAQTKQFKCTMCEKSFEHSGKLHRHMRIHTGERPHECHICGKSFIQSGQLVIHMRSHTGDKPYPCTSCDKAFTCSKQLKVHMRSHTKEKPYKCDICGKSFGYNHVLKLHQVAHYGAKIYKCTLCDATFNTKKHLEVHIKNHEEPLMLPSIRTLSPAPAPSPPVAHAPQCTSFNETKSLLPSINTVVPDMMFSQRRIATTCLDQPEDLSTSSRTYSRVSSIRRNPLFPVTESLVASLMSEDQAKFGHVSPIPSPVMNSGFYGDKKEECMIVTEERLPLTPPPSVSPPVTPHSISSMSESCLPLRKRRHLMSDCSDTEESSRPSPSVSPLSSRSSVICFAK